MNHYPETRSPLRTKGAQGEAYLTGRWRPATSAGIFRLGEVPLGVIGQSSRAIAGSLPNVSQHSVTGESLNGRALIEEVGEKSLTPLSNSECSDLVDGGSGAPRGKLEGLLRNDAT